ncbi:hypothetical protein [Sphaerimonospora thailandensis]|nr:hypothetical protein [Sphaerimonospora thailandensis]
MQASTQVEKIDVDLNQTVATPHCAGEEPLAPRLRTARPPTR